MNYGNIFGFIIGGVVTVGIGGLGIYLLASSIQCNRDAKESLSWPYVVGEITDIKINIHGEQDNKNFRFMPIINYVYQVGVQIYDGNKITFGRGPMFKSQQTAENFMAQYQPGKRIKVYYHPKKPHKAVLKQEAQGTKSSMISGIVLVLVMLSMICSFSFFVRLMG